MVLKPDVVAKSGSMLLKPEIVAKPGSMGLNWNCG